MPPLICSTTAATHFKKRKFISKVKYFVFTDHVEIKDYLESVTLGS